MIAPAEYKRGAYKCCGFFELVELVKINYSGIFFKIIAAFEPRNQPLNSGCIVHKFSWNSVICAFLVGIVHSLQEHCDRVLSFYKLNQCDRLQECFFEEVIAVFGAGIAIEAMSRNERCLWHQVIDRHRTDWEVQTRQWCLPQVRSW